MPSDTSDFFRSSAHHVDLVAERAGAYNSLGCNVLVVKQHGSEEGGERPLGVMDLAVIDESLFECRDENLGEALKILDSVTTEGVGIVDLHNAVEREE